MPNEHEYNGWTNFATWSVVVVIQNDQSMNEHCYQALPMEAHAEAARLSAEEPDRFPAERPRWLLQDMLKDYVQEIIDAEAEKGLPCMLTGLLGAAMCEVDWRDIAENVLADYTEEE